MAETKKYLHNIDVTKNKITNFILNPATTAQRIAIGLVLNTTHQGYVIYDTDDDAQYFWDGTQWITVSTTWGSITGDITTQYDLYTNFVPYTGALNHVELGGLSYKTNNGTYNSEQSSTGFIVQNTAGNTVGVLTYYKVGLADLTNESSLLSNELRFYKNGIGSQSLFPNSTFTNQASTLPSTTGFLANSVNGVAALADGSITIPSGGTTLNGTGFVKASGTTITYDNSTYEPSITGGTSAQYWRGDKTWQTFPTIPAAQIQSDWNQTNNTLLDYIKNKPTIPTVGTWGALNYPTWTSGTPFVKMDAAGSFTLDTNTYLTSAVTSIATAGLISGGTITGTGTITTSMATNKLVGRSTSGVGVMEEITVGTGLSLSAGTLSSTVTGGLQHAIASGTDTYTVTIAGVTAYAEGDAYLIRFTNGNTTASTLNINGIGAAILYRNNDGLLIGGDITANGDMLCVYDTSIPGFRVIGTSPNSLFAYVTNDDSVTITKGMPVYAFGGTGDRMTVKRAFNTGDATSAQTIGLVFSTSIAANQKGLIMIQGLLDGLSILPTSTWNDGDAVYLGATAGSITPTKQYAPNHLVYLGFVTTASNGAAGRMYVRIQNGYELDELHNVQAQTPTLKDTLWYDNTVSPAQWKTASISTILGYTPVGGTGTTNELAYFTAASTIGSLTTATYPSLTELSYVKGVTSAVQTQINAKQDDSAWVDASGQAIAGWASTTTKKIQYKLLGSKTAILQWEIVGTGAAGNTASMTLPFTSSAWGVQTAIYQANQSATSAAICVVNASSTTLNFYSSAVIGGTFSGGQPRNLRGQMIINLA